MSHPAIPNRIFFGHIANLEYRCLEGTYIMNNRVVYRADSVKSDSQPYHIKLRAGETLDSRRIADMAQNLMRESGLQLLRALFKQFYLLARKGIELGRITSYEMREYRTGNNRALVLQAADKQGDIFHGKAETVHTRIQFYMNREVGDSFFFGGFDKRVEQMEIINFRFQFIVEHGFECRKLRIHNHDRGSNACFAEFGTFVGNGYRQIINMMFLQGFGYLIRTGSVGRSFHHTNHFRFRMAEHGTVVVQVVYHGVQIYFQDSFMHFQFQGFGYPVEVEHTRTFYQNDFRMKGFEYVRHEKGFGIGEEIAFDVITKPGGTRGNLRAYANQFINAPALHQLGYTAVERGCTLSGFQYVGQDKRPVQSFLFRTADKEVKGYIQGCQVRIIAVIYQDTVVLSFFYFQAHGNRFEACHPFGDLVGGSHQVETGCQAVQDVFDGSIVNKRNTESIIHIQITVGNDGVVFFLRYAADMKRTFDILFTPGNLTGCQH